MPVHVLRTLLVMTAAAAVLVIGLSDDASARARRAEAQPAWLVVPFETESPSTRTYWIGEGAALAVGDELERLGLRTLSRDVRVAALDGLRLPTSVPLSRATSIRIGELLGAPVVVFGRATSDETSLTVRAQRLHLEAGQLGPEIVESGRLVDLFAVCARLAHRLADRPAGDAAAPATGGAAPPLDAYEAYVKALLTERPEARLRLLGAARDKAAGYEPIRLALWKAHSDLGDHASALTALSGLTAGATGRRARFASALSLIELARYDEAFTLLRGLSDEAAEAAVFNNLGVVQLRRGWTPETGRPTYYFNKAAELEPDAADLFFNLGYAYWDERDARASIYWLREALRRNPADADAHRVLAASLEASGALPEAERERALASQLSARYAESARRAGADPVPRGLERLEDSLEPLHPMRFDAALQAAARRNQQELAAFHLDRGRRLFEQGKDGDAEPELRRVLFLAPYHAEAHLLAGRIYLRSGRVRDALAAFRIALWSEETVAGHVALAEALIEAHDVPAARAQVQRALALDPGSVDARSLLARLDAPAPR